MSKFIIVLLFFSVVASAQRLPQIKPGDCPPPIVSQFYQLVCLNDYECNGQEKCCRTTNGGSLCVMPVTMRRSSIDKPGRCPDKPTGSWVCSSTCSFDSDCRGRTKCCRGRCPGSMICQKAEL